MSTRYVNGVDTMKYTEEEIRQSKSLKGNSSKTWVDLHEGELFGDGESIKRYKQCKDCMFRDETTVQGKECGWYKCVCQIFEAPEYKPDYVSDNAEECEYYEKAE